MNNAITSQYSTSTILERMHYFPRQLITADDMTAEQEYFREKLRRHNRYLHGWGVVCGCEVKANPTSDYPWQVQICPGYVITPQGDEIEIPKSECVNFDLAGNWYQLFDPCPPPLHCPPTAPPPASGKEVVVYLAVCSAECNSRPVRIHPAGCGCDDSACEYTRVRESFELVRLWERELPESHTQADQSDEDWLKKLGPLLSGAATGPLPVPPCPKDTANSCVVLAKITLPDDRNTAISQIDMDERRICFSTGALAILIQAVNQRVP